MNLLNCKFTKISPWLSDQRAKQEPVWDQWASAFTGMQVRVKPGFPILRKIRWDSIHNYNEQSEIKGNNLNFKKVVKQEEGKLVRKKCYQISHLS